MTLREFVESEMGYIWDTYKGSWVTVDSYDPEARLTFLGIFDEEPEWDDQLQRWVAPSPCDRVCITHALNLVLDNIDEKICLPIPQSLGQTFSE